MSTVNLTIDGVACTCEAGEYLWDVAKRNGIEIPALCRSDAFADHRACCRVCIVEVDEGGWTKVVTSCVYPVKRDCTVLTNSPRIAEERALIMALLERRAPASEKLADQASKWGFEADEALRERLVAVDEGKCILCGLCVQACDSLGTGAISTVLRGTEKEVDTPYGRASDACVGCLSCAEVCPTGAITFEQDAETRTIWNRTFERARCERCGAVMGTRAAYERAAEDPNAPVLCDACRKTRLADEMMRSYRYA